jgi:archaemetzincin
MIKGFHPRFYLPAVFFLFVLILACGSTVSDRADKQVVTEKIAVSHLDSIKKSLLPLYDSMKQILPGDWLASHDEKFVSFDEYVKRSPVRPDAKRNVIYIQPFNDLDSNGKNIIPVVAKYLEAFYGLKVSVLPFADNLNVPGKWKRGEGISYQVKSGWFLDNVLAPALPSDAAVMIGLTGTDLYPDEEWNFVFGQASLKKRVGIWSLARLCVSGSMSVNEKKLCLNRLLNTAAHETGHMFSITHCVRFECVMNGSNSLSESDRRDPWLCPDCLYKLSWNLQREPVIHFTALRSFWVEQNHMDRAEFYSKNISALKPK